MSVWGCWLYKKIILFGLFQLCFFHLLYMPYQMTMFNTEAKNHNYKKAS